MAVPSKLEYIFFLGLAEAARAGLATGITGMMMPQVEDGLSSEHASDNDNNNHAATPVSVVIIFIQN